MAAGFLNEAGVLGRFYVIYVYILLRGEQAHSYITRFGLELGWAVGAVMSTIRMRMAKLTASCAVDRPGLPPSVY